MRAYASLPNTAGSPIYILRRGYGHSDGPIPIPVTKCGDSSDADADHLEATLAYVREREDGDTSRIMTHGVCGSCLAVVALGARNIPGLKVVIINISDGLRTTGCSQAKTAGASSRQRVITSPSRAFPISVLRRKRISPRQGQQLPRCARSSIAQGIAIFWAVERPYW